MVKEYKHLTNEEIEFFLENGYLIVKHAFSREKAAEFTRDMWVRLGIDPAHPESWPRDQDRIHMPFLKREPVATFAPRVWEIMKELLGGEERIDEASSAWGDSFIVNLGLPEHWDPIFDANPDADPSTGRGVPDPRTLENWHVDGDFFVHFLDSPEQALLVIPLFSDILPGGGATYIAPEGIARTARYLAAHPEGVLPGQLAFVSSTSPFASDPHADPAVHSHPAQARACGRFVELTGDTGDVVLLHPLMLHSASRNRRRGVPRVITNPPVALRAPFEFARADPDAYSLVERATLRALGVDRLEFAPTTERRSIVPLRVIREQQVREEERKRLEAAQAARAQEQPVTSVEVDAARPIAVA
ncbi:hypothetical protein C8Q77DRAFT_1218855 [Trametes polyzona]|nr:hypothetical protein C8Q77DRAFT_1218855 [Trametes polyzona]